ncbi:winged helix-turn-helix domain-containing protein [Tabrizicola sp. J26]|uniref:winged helix-turn-helix domain-containing tetratricopeptide repeat protein n=1 Tax=Alitabrizicola rongguiensis TaxID=2909234 RepID=UPI001F1DCAE6|nr:winged helix-turn-helix domain-containing protein [Tabrizicola rongguiensis]MCF1707636.1 winged helix-turn-helix domain-containing protein [Tabrizicola rongguiensis]
MGREGSIRFGACTLDEQRGLLLRDGDVVHLRAKTFALLVEFCHSPDRVLTKDDLFARLWPGVVVTEDSLTQAISELRRTLGPEARRLRTVPKRGYLFSLADEGRPVAAQAEKPMVAVFPFHAASAEDQALADGLAEETTHCLGRYGLIGVVARHSAFELRPDYGKAANAARQLGASHHLEGIIHPRPDGSRLSVALCETASGRQIWGETFALEGASLRETAAAIPHRIVARLNLDLERSIALRPIGSGTDDLGAFQHFVAATSLLRQYGPGVNERARAHLEAALALDPGFALAHAYLGLATILIAGHFSAPPAEKDRALAFTLTGIRLAPEEARCHFLTSVVRMYRREFASIELHSRRALALNPYDADLMAWHGCVLTMRGNPVEGLEWLDRARTLNPLHPDWYHVDIAIAHQALGRYTDALAHLRSMPETSPFRFMRMAACEAMLGNPEAAAAYLDRAEGISPGWDPIAKAATVELERVEDRDRFVAEVARAVAMRDSRRSQ